jgi:hypothetical protein
VRTHKQADQVLKELKRSPYKNHRAIAIGSRAHLCNNDEVRSSANRDFLCRSLKSKCHHFRALRDTDVGSFDGARESQFSFNSLDFGGNSQSMSMSQTVRTRSRAGRKHSSNSYGDKSGCGSKTCKSTKKEDTCCSRNFSVGDVEDLRTNLSPGCAYYGSHILAGAADIVVCPHNYILDPMIARCAVGHRANWSLDNRIIVLDEAHNVEELCREVGSFELGRAEVEELLRQFELIGHSGRVGSNNVVAKFPGSSTGGAREKWYASEFGALSLVTKKGNQNLSLRAGCRRLAAVLRALVEVLPVGLTFGCGYAKSVESLVEEVFRKKKVQLRSGSSRHDKNKEEKKPSQAESTGSSSRGRQNVSVLEASVLLEEVGRGRGSMGSAGSGAQPRTSAQPRSNVATETNKKVGENKENAKPRFNPPPRKTSSDDVIVLDDTPDPEEKQEKKKNRKKEAEVASKKESRKESDKAFSASKDSTSFAWEIQPTLDLCLDLTDCILQAKGGDEGSGALSEDCNPFYFTTLKMISRFETLLQRIERLVRFPSAYIVKVEGKPGFDKKEAKEANKQKDSKKEDHFGSLSVLCMMASAFLLWRCVF